MKLHIFSILSAILALSLTACNDSDSNVTNGSLSVNNGSGVTIGETVAHAIPVALNGSSGVKALAVDIASSDNSIATVYPKTCYLSSTSGHHSCLVFLRGKNDGTVSITASATGYDKASSKVVVNEIVGSKPVAQNMSAIKAATTPNYGQLQIASFPSANHPSTSNFAMTAQVGDIITLATSITNFDTPLNGVPIFLSVNNGATIVGNPQCNVDSNYDANHYCLYKVQLPTAAGSITATATAVGNNAGDFSNAPTATITVQNNAVPGQIVLQGTGTGIPQGMSSPFWAVLQDSSGVTTPLSVSISGSSGLSINPASGGSASCSLSSANPVCGFGVLGTILPPSGSNYALSASESTGSYTINPLNVTVVTPQTSVRTLSFQNNDANTVWVGITGGTAASFLTNQMVATLNPQTSGANVTCGPSNPAAACPTGSTCRQGGANPASGTVYYCYWDQPVPSNGYAISLTSQPTTSISISESSYSPLTDITWSGNFYPRQGCTTTTTSTSTGTNTVFQCAIADCGNGTASQACAPGTGGAPGIATLPEVTLQANNNDYYDISIIGGANVKTTFGPDPSTSPPTASNYFCGVAGASSAQGSLSAADWGMATHITQSPVTGVAAPYSTSIQTAATPSTAYYHYIQTPQGGRVGQGCAAQTNPTSYCEDLDSVPAAASNYVCGYDANAVNNGTSSDYQTSCGSHLAWLSANAIFALNADTSSNNAPFPFSTTYITSAAGTVSLSSLYLCNNSTNQSGYAVEDASTACGCTNWGDSGLGTMSSDAPFSAQIAAPTQACSTNNLAGATNYWTTYVLPTIAWLKQSCPTCYTYPFDDMSSTFQCSNQATPSGLNSVAYLIQFNGNIPGK
jgi:hypothetical protein